MKFLAELILVWVILTGETEKASWVIDVRKETVGV